MVTLNTAPLVSVYHHYTGSARDRFLGPHTTLSRYLSRARLPSPVDRDPAVSRFVFLPVAAAGSLLFRDLDAAVQSKK